jgi:signal transduction histidine kinase
MKPKIKFAGGPSSVNLKLALSFAAALIVGATLWYANVLVRELQLKEREVVRLYARGLEYVANSNAADADVTFLFENIVKPIDFPVVLTDAEDRVDVDNEANIRNVPIDSTLPKEKRQAILDRKIAEMDETNEPITVAYTTETDTIPLTRIHYGDSRLITQLKYFPYAQIAVAAAFVVIGYVAFSTVKRSEQSNIWVGMAKETAHQFGTPLSSLMGWTELLKINHRDPDKALDAAEEIENDIEKLQKITNRFSKIGSKPSLAVANVIETIERTTEYFHRRLPQTGKQVELRIKGDRDATALLNADLFEWVLENLIKNALDAIEHDDGVIEFVVAEERKRVVVEASDNGKGIGKKRKKDVFRPGYSTKRRGWGLGLSLAKRIVEQYHRGKIFVKASSPETGTTFRVELRKP